MQTGAALTLALNVAQSINDPQQKVGQPSAGLQLQNASSFTIQVLTEGMQWTIQPFTAQTVPVNGQPVTITPILATGTTAPSTSLIPVWLQPNPDVQSRDVQPWETPPMTDGALTAAALVSAFAGVVTQPFDFLGSKTDIYRHLSTASFTVPAVNQYATIIVTTGGPDQPCAILVTNTTKSFLGMWQSFPTNDGTTKQLYFPVPAQPGDILTITYTAVGTADSNSSTLRVYGASFGIQPSPLRSDGRLRVRGDNLAGIAPSSTTTMIAAPIGASAAARILLKHLAFSCIASGAQGIQATINGTTTNLLRLDVAGQQAQLDFGDGLLLDSNTAVTDVVVAGNNSAEATYDLVV